MKSFSGPYPVPMRENTDQKNSEYRHCTRSESQSLGIFNILTCYEVETYTGDTSGQMKLIDDTDINI